MTRHPSLTNQKLSTRTPADEDVQTEQKSYLNAPFIPERQLNTNQQDFSAQITCTQTKPYLSVTHYSGFRKPIKLDYRFDS